MLIRALPATWTGIKKVFEGDFSEARIKELNDQYYNVYYFPNHPDTYDPGSTVNGSHIDTFNWVFVDMDLKDCKFASKDEFIASLASFPLLPTKIVDSGRGVHAYWRIKDLDAMSYLRLQCRLAEKLKTDPEVSKICQLMRLEGYNNVKDEGKVVPCQLMYGSDVEYTCEQLDSVLPPITQADETYCQTHYNKTNKIADKNTSVDDRLPFKFAKLLEQNQEVKSLWAGGLKDRSNGDFRLAHVMFANGFTKDEAMSTLVNCAKALERSPIHRIGYAEGIVEKIWTAEEQKTFIPLSSSVKDLVSKGTNTLAGTRLYGPKYLDNTHGGFRLGQVLGLVGGTGVGKTAICLDGVRGFVENNPEYDHLMASLEQPAREIAMRWNTMCGDNSHLNEKLQILDNYNEDGTFRGLSLDQIRQYIKDYEKHTGRKIGSVTIDHIGILSNSSKNGESDRLIQICQKLKSFALETNTFVMILSQSPRQKAGIGDIELDKDAAYGTTQFEWYLDFLVTLWQPLKRVYNIGAPTLTALKFCKIRHKNAKLDTIKEDVRYLLYFNPETQMLMDITQDQTTQFEFYYNEAITARNSDKNEDVVPYESAKWSTDERKPDSSKVIKLVKSATGVH